MRNPWDIVVGALTGKERLVNLLAFEGAELPRQIKWSRMSSLNDIEICNKITQCLFDNAPAGPKKIIMRAILADEGDACQFEFDWINKENEINWFLPEGLAGTTLTELLASHKEYFVSSNQPPWKSCRFTVDVEDGKFSMELFYGDDDIVYPAC